eukprot:TRINITY_DN32046_c0_g1_i1.p1 TRINITY_DN32046_c0_g1~~TRINITY_DN32046_c0_g1_i1.p1  ORF type:complete len:462 (+),score=166.27 TRINITY_DN32046_c0_g1_i1:76-1461(+)
MAGIDTLTGLGLNVKRVLSRVPADRRAALTNLSKTVFGSKVTKVKRLRRSDALGMMMRWPAGTRKPEVMFVGQSNAGKSTLLENLCEVRAVEVGGLIGDTHGTTEIRRSKFGTGAFAGRTEGLNRYGICNTLNLVDTPGYGFAAPRKSKTAVVRFSNTIPLIKQYMACCAASLLHRVYIVIPAQQGRVAPPDAEILDVCKEYGISHAVVLSKIDKVSPTELTRTVMTLQDQIGEADTDIIPVTRASLPSVLDLRLDVLHAVTKWLPVDQLDPDDLQQFEYDMQPPTPDEMLAVMNKYARPQTAHERKLQMAQVMAMDVDPREHRALKLSKLRGQYLDDLQRREAYAAAGKEAPKRASMELPDLSGLITRSGGLEAMAKDASWVARQAAQAANEKDQPSEMNLMGSAKKFTDTKTDPQAERRREMAYNKRQRAERDREVHRNRDRGIVSSTANRRRRLVSSS